MYLHEFMIGNKESHLEMRTLFKNAQNMALSDGSVGTDSLHH